MERKPPDPTWPRLPEIVVVGSPNVGKSTFCNRLIGRRKSIVLAEAGTTRDRVSAVTSWEGRHFTLVDTGGMRLGGREAFDACIDREVEKAVEEADLILFLADAKSGVTALDELIAEKIRKSSKPILLAVNKVDGLSRSEGQGEFYRLGLGEPAAISAMEGFGIGDLMERAVKLIAEVREVPGSPDFGLAIVGEPNVGKSTLLNALLCKERAIVTEIAGTTRDSLEEMLAFKDHWIRLVDTAGIHHPKKVKDVPTLFSITRARRSIGECDVAFLIFDAEKGIRADTKKIASLLEKERKPSLLVANKWDLVKRTEQAAYEKDLKADLRFLAYAPLVFISAEKGRNLDRLLDLGIDLWRRSSHHIPTRELNEFLERMRKRRLPSGAIRLKFLTQTASVPQEFVCFVRGKKMIPKNYMSHFENELKRIFHLEGIPIRLVFREAEPKDHD